LSDASNAILDAGNQLLKMTQEGAQEAGYDPRLMGYMLAAYDEIIYNDPVSRANYWADTMKQSAKNGILNTMISSGWLEGSSAY